MATVTLLWIVLFSLLGSVGAMLGGAVLLAFPAAVRTRLLPVLLSYATGTLLAAAWLGMLPQALQQLAPLPVTSTVLAGMVAFFILEKLVLWRHCHDGACALHDSRNGGFLILVGDAFHNFVDGMVIAAAFLVSIPFGVAATLAVVAHEIPQDVGDFAILLDSGFSRTRAFAYNLISSLATLPGAVLGYFFLDAARQWIPYVLAVSAASFIYIAVADLVPSLHRQTGLGTTARQGILLLAGIATIALFRLGH